MELETIRVNETRQTRKQMHLVFFHMWTPERKNMGHDSGKKTMEGRIEKWGLKGGRERGRRGKWDSRKTNTAWLLLHVESRFKKSGLEDGWG